MKKTTFTLFFVLILNSWQIFSADAALRAEYQGARLHQKNLKVNDFLVNKVDTLYKGLASQKNLDAMQQKTIRDESATLLDTFLTIKPFKSSGRVASEGTQKNMYFSLFKLAQMRRKYLSSSILLENKNLGLDDHKENVHLQNALLFLMVAAAAANGDAEDFLVRYVNPANRLEKLKGTSFIESLFGKSIDATTKKEFGITLTGTTRQKFNAFWGDAAKIQATQNKIGQFFGYLKDFWAQSQFSELKPAVDAKCPIGDMKGETGYLDFIDKVIQENRAPDGITYAEKVDAWKKNPDDFVQAIQADVNRLKYKDDTPPKSYYTRGKLIMNTPYYVKMLLSKYKYGPYEEEEEEFNFKTLKFEKVKKQKFGCYIDSNGEALGSLYTNDGVNGFDRIKEASKPFTRHGLLSYIHVDSGDIKHRQKQLSSEDVWDNKTLKIIHKPATATLDEVRLQIQSLYNNLAESMIRAYAFAKASGPDTLADYFDHAFPQELHCTASIGTIPLNWLTEAAKTRWQMSVKKMSPKEASKEAYKRQCHSYIESSNSFIANDAPKMVDQWVIRQIFDDQHGAKQSLLGSDRDNIIKSFTELMPFGAVGYFEHKKQTFVDETFKTIIDHLEKEVLKHLQEKETMQDNNANGGGYYNYYWNQQPNKDFVYKTTDGDITYKYTYENGIFKVKQAGKMRSEFAFGGGLQYFEEKSLKDILSEHYQTFIDEFKAKAQNF